MHRKMEKGPMGYRRSAGGNLQQSRRWSTGCCVCCW